MNPDIPVWKTLWFRSLGWLPLTFFIARVIEYVQVGTPTQVLWMCHLSNLLAAAALFLGNPLLIRVAAILLVFGIPPWIADMWMIRIVTPVSVASHIGGMIVGLLALAKVGTKARSWLPSLAVFVFVQQLCRFLTPENLNVNGAHYAYGPWKNLFASYWLYWFVMTALVAIGLWLVELVLTRLLPKAEA